MNTASLVGLDNPLSAGFEIPDVHGGRLNAGAVASCTTPAMEAWSCAHTVGTWIPATSRIPMYRTLPSSCVDSILSAFILFSLQARRLRRSAPESVIFRIGGIRDD